MSTEAVSPDLVSLIVGALRELGGDVNVPVDVSAETPLFGRHGILDSLALVSLVVAVEQAIEDRFGVAVSLADQNALSQRQSPYRTIASLAEYASRLIREPA
jgi:acyl carrier protein